MLGWSPSLQTRFGTTSRKGSVPFPYAQKPIHIYIMNVV